MKKTLSLTILVSSLQIASAQMAPPPIPSGPVTYTSVVAPVSTPASDTILEGVNAAPPTVTVGDALTMPPVSMGESTLQPPLLDPAFDPAHDPSNTTLNPTMTDAQSVKAAAAFNPGGPILEPSSSKNMWDLRLNLYTAQYNVRGMGVTNHYSNDGFSSMSFAFTAPNHNLFNAGIQQRVYGELGRIWGGGEELNGFTGRAGYGLGKEVFPNALLELGYNMRYGTLEGYMAKRRGKTPHSLAQDFALSLTFNDQQEGFFGAAQLGYGFYGLTGWYYDLGIGYRLTEIISTKTWGLDMEYSIGMAGSVGYWTGDADGIDAYRIRATFLPYMHQGDFGRDGRWHVAPWIEYAISGSNDSAIDRSFPGLVDTSQFNVGIEVGWKF